VQKEKYQLSTTHIDLKFRNHGSVLLVVATAVLFSFTFFQTVADIYWCVYRMRYSVCKKIRSNASVKSVFISSYKAAKIRFPLNSTIGTKTVNKL